MMFLSDRRWGRRQVTDALVRFLALRSTLGVGRITNVSVTGAFMESGVKLPLASLVRLESIERAGNAARKRLSACVVRCTPHGVGLQWCECAADSTVYAHFESAYRDSLEFLSPLLREYGDKPVCHPHLDFKDRPRGRSVRLEAVVG